MKSKLYVDEIYDKAGVNKIIDLQESIVYAENSTVVADIVTSTTGVNLQTPSVQFNGIDLFTYNTLDQKVEVEDNVKFPSGMVINVEYPTPITNTTHYTFNSSTNYQEIQEMIYYYIPKMNNSKILIMWNLHLGFGYDTSQNVRLSVNGQYELLGDGSYISSGPSVYSTSQGSSINLFEGKYLFQNSFKNQVRLSLFGANSGASFYLNRAHDFDDSSRHRTPSYWTIFEISG